MMKIIHTISSMGIKSGGTSSSTYELVKGLNEINVCTDILTLSITQDDVLIGPDKFIKTISNDMTYPFGYSSNFIRVLDKTTKCDIWHINGLWLHLNYITAKKALQKDTPYIITPHGMLYPHALSLGRWKKIPVFELFFRKLFNEASCIHATCHEELKHLRALKITSPIAVVPNLVPKPFFIDDIKRSNDKFRICFLGRLHPIKCVTALLEAWAECQILDGELYIIGSGDSDYESSIKDKIRSLGLNNVFMQGFITGKGKFELLAQMTCLVLPSDSENFGMVVPEALMVGTIVIASKGTPWKILEQYQCGYWINNDVNSIASTIKSVYTLSTEERNRMGINGKKLVEKEYSVKVIANKMLSVYNWVLNKSEKPDYIYL